MATIDDSVKLQIFENNPSPGDARVQVSYKITATGGDAMAGAAYRELVQLYKGEEPINDSTISDEVVVFDQNEVAFVRNREKILPLATLREGPLQDVNVRARVSLSPIPPSRDSNVVTLAGGVIG